MTNNDYDRAINDMWWMAHNTMKGDKPQNIINTWATEENKELRAVDYDVLFTILSGMMK